MKEHSFFKEIRKLNILKLIFPILIICLLIFATIYFSIFDGLFPETVDQSEYFTSVYSKENKHIKMHFSQLYYSGYDYLLGSDIRGHYYYLFNNGKCEFVLLKKMSDEPPAVIEDIDVIGRLNYQPSELPELINLVAKDINWTYDGLNSSTCELILDEPSYHKVLLIIVSIVFAIAFILALGNCTLLIFNIIRPDYSYNFTSLGHHQSRQKIILQASKEFQHDIVFDGDPLYITDNYFIYLGSFNAAIIPLKDIKQAYKHSNYYNILFFSWMSYTLRVTTIHNQKFHFRGNEKTAVDAFLATLKECNPNTTIGYK